MLPHFFSLFHILTILTFYASGRDCLVVMECWERDDLSGYTSIHTVSVHTTLLSLSVSLSLCLSTRHRKRGLSNFGWHFSTDSSWISIAGAVHRGQRSPPTHCLTQTHTHTYMSTRGLILVSCTKPAAAYTSHSQALKHIFINTRQTQLCHD